MSTLILLQVHGPTGHIKYVSRNIALPDNVYTTLYGTKWGARRAVEKLRRKALDYPSLYGTHDYRWDWDDLKNHPDYKTYLDEYEAWRKANKKYNKLPAVKRADAEPPKYPPVPASNQAVPSTNMATPSSNSATIQYVSSNQTMSTSDNYDALVLQMTDLTYKVETLQNQLNLAAELGDEEMENQKKAIIALGAVIKGMDDRIEDLEHAVDFRDLPQ